MSHDKLAYMANQIGRFFAHQKEDQAVAAINDHILKFWDPRMRKQLLGELDTAELDPRVRRAVEQLKNPA
jgi:formate dehydrogenase subunit delta